MILPAALAAALYCNATTYCFDFRNNMACWDAMSFIFFETAKICRLCAPHRKLLMSWQLYDSPTRVLLLKGGISVQTLKDDVPFPADANKEERLTILLLQEKWPRLKSEILRLYPGARWWMVKNPWGEELFVVVDVPRRVSM